MGEVLGKTVEISGPGVIEETKCPRCGKPVILLQGWEAVKEPVCINCVTDEEWESTGVSPEKAKQIIKETKTKIKTGTTDTGEILDEVKG
ncbi:MAG TPA: hypothetical protein ENI23_01385, partial [bacterium]|nr:hypothetical protein [bacterium]